MEVLPVLHLWFPSSGFGRAPSSPGTSHGHAVLTSAARQQNIEIGRREGKRGHQPGLVLGTHRIPQAL
eukprot:1160524-Pelagomonas_calceolata.AAC.4